VGALKDHELSEIERILAQHTDEIIARWEAESASGVIAKVRIELDEYTTLAPVSIPNLDDVRDFAQRVHARRQGWHGEAFGCRAGYDPGSPEPPPGSKMAFTPADFWIGDGAIWFFALLWEHGNDQPPVETVYDKNIVGAVE